MSDVRTITKEDARYPSALHDIKDAPKALYYRGTLPGNEPLVGIVGTRRPSPYGHQAALHMAGELAEAGVTVVSGMAPGIDTFAHQACVERGKKTIAVLGTGLDEPSMYPRQNIDLSRKIVAQGGCLLSELPPGSHGSTFSFPRRNRIISALSAVLLVVEAKAKSGSLITADYARKQGKKVFAVPGPIFSLNSEGPHKLLMEGALLADHAGRILQELAIAPAARQELLTTGNPQETMVLGVLQEGALHIDRIIEKTQLGPAAISSTLAIMEISGKIRNLGGNMYSLN